MSIIASTLRSEDDNSVDVSTFNVLDDDSILEIFSYLFIIDRLLCKRWKDLTAKSWASINKFVLGKGLGQLKLIYKSQMRNHSIVEQVLKRCGQYLTHFSAGILYDLDCYTLTLVGKYCPNLTYVHLPKISSSIVNAMVDNCKNIIQFDVAHVTEKCEHDLINLFIANKNLRNIRMACGFHMSGVCLEYLPAELLKLHVSGCESINLRYFNVAIRKFYNLRDFRFTVGNKCDNFDQTLQIISSMKELIVLQLYNLRLSVSIHALHDLANLVKLEKLYLDAILTVNDDLIITISKNCKHLKLLSISKCSRVTNRGILCLAQLPKLELLNIGRIGSVTDEAIINLKNLKLLACYGCRSITDYGILTLMRNAPNLTTLDAYLCTITANAINKAIDIIKERASDTVFTLCVDKTTIDVNEITSEIPPNFKWQRHSTIICTGI